MQTINLFLPSYQHHESIQQLNQALEFTELKLPNCESFRVTACLPTLNNLPPKLLGIQPPFFPRTTIVSICMNLSNDLFSCRYPSYYLSQLFCMITRQPPFRTVECLWQLSAQLFYARSVTVVRCFIKHQVVTIELYT